MSIYDSHGLKVSATNDREHHRWNIIPIEGNKYKIKNIGYGGQYLYKPDERSISISNLPSDDEADHWILEPVLKVNSNTDLFMDEFFRFDNLGDIPTWVDVDVISGISTTSEVSDETEVKTSVTAGLHHEGGGGNFNAELGLGFGLSFTKSVAKMESLQQKTNIRIQVQPGESVRLEQPVAYMSHSNAEDIFQLKSNRIRRVKATLNDRQCSSQTQVQENTEYESVDDTHLVSGALYVIENGDLNNQYNAWAEEFVGDAITMGLGQVESMLKPVSGVITPMVVSLLGDIIDTETGTTRPLWMGIDENGNVRSYNNGILSDKQIWKLQQEGNYWYIISHSDDVTRITVQNDTIGIDSGDVSDSQKWKFEKHGNNWWNFAAPIDEREYQISSAAHFCPQGDQARDVNSKVFLLST